MRAHTVLLLLAALAGASGLPLNIPSTQQLVDVTDVDVDGPVLHSTGSKDHKAVEELSAPNVFGTIKVKRSPPIDRISFLRVQPPSPDDKSLPNRVVEYEFNVFRDENERTQNWH